MAEKKQPKLEPGTVIRIKKLNGWEGVLAEVSEHKERVKAFIVVPNQGRAYVELSDEQYDIIEQIR